MSGRRIAYFAGPRQTKVLTQGPVRNYNPTRRKKPFTEKGV